MSRRIAIIQGHPDGSQRHFGHALAAAYEAAARSAGHEVALLEVAGMDLDFLRSRTDWESAPGSEAVRQAQTIIAWAEHLVIVYPLWLGSMPALLKAFFEQVFRPGFAVDAGTSEPWKQRLRGRSARLVVTMGMPAWVYRAYFLSHGLKAFERNILKFCGISPVRASLIGMVEAPDPAARTRWLREMSTLGARGG